MQITLKSARVNAGYNQKEVAKILKVSHQTLGYWENGKTSIDVNNLKKLLELYNVKIENIKL